MDSSDFARLFATAPLGSNRPNTNVGFAAAAKAVKGGRSGPEAEQLVGDVINGKLRRQDGELVSATDQTVHEQIGRYFVRFDVELNEFVPNGQRRAFVLPGRQAPTPFVRQSDGSSTVTLSTYSTTVGPGAPALM